MAAQQLGARALGRLARVLSRSERDRLRQVRTREARVESLIGRAMIRCGAALYTGFPPAAVRLGEGAHGKPELADPAWAERLRFNVSHARGLIGCAFTQHPLIGIDLEHPRRALDVEAIVDLHFAPAEAADVKARAGGARLRRFLLYWTLKEAYLKAVGVGLTVPLCQAAITVDHNARASLADAQPIDWQLSARRHGSHILAVAVSTGAPSPPDGQSLRRASVRVRAGLRLLSEALGWDERTGR